MAMYNDQWERPGHDGTYGAADASDLSGFDLDMMTRIPDAASLAWNTTASQGGDWPAATEYITPAPQESLPCQNPGLYAQSHIHPGQQYPNAVPNTTTQNQSSLFFRNTGAFSVDAMNPQLTTVSGSNIAHPCLDKGYPDMDECEDSCSEADCCGPCELIPCDAEDCEQEDCTPCDDDNCFWGSIHDSQYGSVPQTEDHWSHLDAPFTQYHPCLESHPQGGMHHPGQQQPCSHHPGEHNAIAVLHEMQRRGPSGDPWDPMVSAPPIETPPLCPDDGGFEMIPEGEPLELGARNTELSLVCQWLVDHGDNKFVPCNCTFNTPKELHSHLVEWHTPEFNGKTGFNCLWDGCFRGKDQTFASRHKLHRHLPSHSGYKPLVCKICSLGFSAKQALEQHERIHSGEEPYECPYEGCNKKFKQKSALTMHKRTHTGEKPLQCATCGKQFAESSNLSKHRKIHEPVNRFKCNFEGCQKEFVRIDQLKRHHITHAKRLERKKQLKECRAKKTRDQ